MEKEDAIVILQESERQNRILIADPAVFFRVEDIANGLNNAERRACALNMAVTALRAQQTKLDRSRWEGCNVCKNPFSAACCSGLLNAPVNYCPACGRPLTEQAWAELERRINGGTADNQTL